MSAKGMDAARRLLGVVCLLLSFPAAGAGLELDPGGAPYPDYLADPRSPRMRVGVGVAEAGLAQASAARIAIDTGARYTLAKYTPADNEGEPVWIDIEGGVFLQFDPSNSLDNLGWDGRFGVYGVRRLGDDLVARVGYRHLSSHLGDELIERTGRTRIGYTREGAVAGLQYELTPHIAAYAEPAYAFHLGEDPRLERWSVDAGVQYRGPPDRLGGAASLIGGVHVDAHSETDWNPSVSVMVGQEFRGVSNTGLRLQLEAYHGRALIGEFALDFTDTYLLMSFVVDFYPVDFY